MNRFAIFIWLLLFGGGVALAKEEVAEKPDRPHFSIFGFTIQADEIDANMGEARGNVVVDGTAANAKNPKLPLKVEAEFLKVDLAAQSVMLSGWPTLSWPGASLVAKSAETKVKLMQGSYSVEGPAAYSLNLGEMKKLAK